MLLCAAGDSLAPAIYGFCLHKELLPCGTTATVSAQVDCSSRDFTRFGYTLGYISQGVPTRTLCYETKTAGFFGEFGALIQNYSFHGDHDAWT